MDMSMQLFILCEEFIGKLQELIDQEGISREEFESMTKYKLKFIEDRKGKSCPKS